METKGQKQIQLSFKFGGAPVKQSFEIGNLSRSQDKKVKLNFIIHAIKTREGNSTRVYSGMGSCA